MSVKQNFKIIMTCLLQDGKMLVWDAFTTNKVNFLFPKPVREHCKRTVASHINSLFHISSCKMRI